MNEKICKKCKHWERNKKHYEHQTVNFNYGNCDSPKFKYDGGYAEEQESEKDNLFYYDSEGFSACFSTGEDFGCIHFVKKD